jgi:uncharacterized protein (DUF697 family)
MGAFLSFRHPDCNTAGSMSELGDALRAIREGKLDEASPEEKDASVAVVVYSSSTAAGIVALQPVPFLDPLVLLPIHVAMFQAIGRVRGYHLDKKSTLEILSSWRRSILVQEVAVTVTKLVPVYGWALSAASAQALTYAMGRMADYYFVNGRSMVPAEIREVTKDLYRQRMLELREKKGWLRWLPEWLVPAPTEQDRDVGRTPQPSESSPVGALAPRAPRPDRGPPR